MEDILYIETNNWNGKILLKEDGYFEGVAFNEKSDISTDLITGIYDKGIGKIYFKTGKSKNTYELDDKNLIDGYYVTIKDKDGSFEGTCTDEFSRVSYLSLSLTLHEIEDKEFSSELDDLKMLINSIKDEVYTEAHIYKLRRIK
nr:hypothetical protein [Bacilli bacterium]